MHCFKCPFCSANLKEIVIGEAKKPAFHEMIVQTDSFYESDKKVIIGPAISCIPKMCTACGFVGMWAVKK